MDLVLTRGREGVQNPENLADVICERPPTPCSLCVVQPFVIATVNPNFKKGVVFTVNVRDSAHAPNAVEQSMLHEI